MSLALIVVFAVLRRGGGAYPTAVCVSAKAPASDVYAATQLVWGLNNISSDGFHLVTLPARASAPPAGCIAVGYSAAVAVGLHVRICFLPPHTSHPPLKTAGATCQWSLQHWRHFECLYFPFPSLPPSPAHTCIAVTTPRARARRLCRRPFCQALHRGERGCRRGPRCDLRRIARNALHGCRLRGFRRHLVPAGVIIGDAPRRVCRLVPRPRCPPVPRRRHPCTNPCTLHVSHSALLSGIGNRP